MFHSLVTQPWVSSVAPITLVDETSQNAHGGRG